MRRGDIKRKALALVVEVVILIIDDVDDETIGMGMNGCTQLGHVLKLCTHEATNKQSNIHM